ncbi:MAG: helix-turn-helix domain-containing protein [Desulfomonilaceae bacterium]
MIEQRSENHGDPTSIERLLTAATVACILGVSPKTVHKLVREGKLPCVQVTPRERRVAEEIT